MLPHSIIKYLEDGNFDYVMKNEQDQLRNLKTPKDLEQLLSLCSHFLYHKEAFTKDQLSALVNIVILASASRPEDSNATNIFKSLCYILLLGLKKGLEQELIMKLIEEIEGIVSNEVKICLDHSDSFKRIYASLWNFSIQKGLSPSSSFRFQGYALKFLCLVDENLDQVCANFQKAEKRAESFSCPSETIEAMYTKILSTIVLYLRRKPSIHSYSVISLNSLLIDYAKYLYKNKKFSEFSTIFKQLASCLESVCDPQIFLSFKKTIKMIEAGITFMLQPCEVTAGMLTGLNVIAKTSLVANTILTDGLLFLYQIMEPSANSSKIALQIDSIFNCLTERMSENDNLSNESFLKVLEAYNNYLNYFVTHIVSDTENKEELLNKALKPLAALRILTSKLERSKGAVYIYNIGIHCCNMGVIAFKANIYKVASEFLVIGVQYLNINYIMCDESQKVSVLSIMKKKGNLLKDSLRYSGQYKEAALKTVHLALQGILPMTDIIPTWIKCKKDALRANSSYLKKICIKDIFWEVESDLNTSKLIYVIEEYLIQELFELKQLCYNTGDDEMLCSRALLASKKVEYNLEGSLALCKTLLLYPDLSRDGETAIGIINDLFSSLKNLVNKDRNTSFYLESKARALLLLYLCNLQLIQEKAAVDVEEKKEEEPLTVQSTDLGEEVQPQDACSIRPSTSLATFAIQEAALDHLRQALLCWEQLIEESSSDPTIVCDNLLAIGYVFKLAGLLPDCIKAFSLLLAQANKSCLKNMWIKGMIELIEVVPELIPLNIASQLQSLVSNKELQGKTTVSDSTKFASFVALAFYYYKIGEYTKGAEILLDCLAHPIMEKRSSSATELQAGVYFVASHYAFLPLSVLPKDQKPKEPCLPLALFATRKAIALINLLSEQNYPEENICWRHKVAWLHHVTNVWLGRLCLLTSQPRLGRAYLRRVLNISEKLALPLRTIELMCSLAEIDLHCDQLDDCRVKIDSLNKSIQAHASETWQKDPIESIIANLKEATIKKSPPQKPNQDSGLVPIFTDNEEFVSEKLREGEEYTDCLKNLNFTFVIGDARRIPQLAIDDMNSANQCPSSPSIGFREKNFFVSSVICPKGIIDCLVCIAPELHSVAVRTQIMMGFIHAQQGNFSGARKCFVQAENDLLKFWKSSDKIYSKLNSIIAIGQPLGSQNVADHDLFINSHMAFAKLLFLFFRTESLCVERTNWVEAELKAKDALTILSNLNSVILHFNHPLVVQLILQGEAISKTIKSLNNSCEENEKVESPVYFESQPLRPSLAPGNAPSNFKTPASNLMTRPWKKYLFASKLKAPGKNCLIFTDPNSGTLSSENTQPNSNQPHQDISGLTTTFDKLALDEHRPNNKAAVNSSFDGSVDESHDRKLPDRFDLSAHSATKVDAYQSSKQSTTLKADKTRRTSAETKVKRTTNRKTTTKKPAQEPNQDLENDDPHINVKDSSEQIAKQKSESQTYATRSSAKTSTSATSVVKTHRPRNQRNLNRL